MKEFTSVSLRAMRAKYIPIQQKYLYRLQVVGDHGDHGLNVVMTVEKAS